MKKRIVKVMSVILSMAMVTGIVYFARGEQTATTVYAEDNKSAALQNVIETAAGLTGNSGEEGKEETVYVIGDAQGNNNRIIVSDWLKNGSSADEIKDKTDLTDVTNVKGYEDYTKNSDGTI